MLRVLLSAALIVAVGVSFGTASAAAGHDASLAQASKKKSCKKKKKKKCKAGDPAKTPLSATITSCPTGSVSGSNVATVSGTAAVGPRVTTYVTYNQLDPSGYFDTLVSQEVRVYPSASGVWSHSFTPGFPQSWTATTSWEEQVVVSNYHAHDGVSASCSWTVVR